MDRWTLHLDDGGPYIWMSDRWMMVDDGGPYMVDLIFG